MALPAAIATTLGKARALRSLWGAASRGTSRSQRKRRASCCWTSCAGCGACLAVTAAVGLAVGGALVAATAALIGTGAAVCSEGPNTRCGAATAALAGVPMNCPGLSVSQGFGDTPWEHPHTGLDIVCPPGTTVVAVVSGIFYRKLGAPARCLYPAARTGGLGIYGELVSGATRYLYGHLQGFAAADGEQVIAGQPIGFEGATGCATGDHLHFEVIVGEQPIDPCPLLPMGYPETHDASGFRCWGNAPP